MTRPQIYDEAYYARMRGAQEGGDGDLYRMFADLVGDTLAGLRVLDAGCGRGELMASLARAGAEVHGFDFSPAAVSASRASTAGLVPPERIREGSIADRSLYGESTFDLVFMTDIVEHLPPGVLAEGLANVRFWLRPGGRLLIHTFPTLGPHTIYRRWLKLRGRLAELRELDEIHCNVQTRERLRAAVEAAGLECRRLWLQNDLEHTSSVYQALPDGWLKRGAKLLFAEVPGLPAVAGLFDNVGLAELVSPSIYCEAIKAR